MALRPISEDLLWFGPSAPDPTVIERGARILAAVPLAGGVGRPVRRGHRLPLRGGRCAGRRPLRAASVRPGTAIGDLNGVDEVDELDAGILLRRVHVERAGVDLDRTTGADLCRALRRSGFRLLSLPR